MFQPDTYTTRRKELRQKVSDGIILLIGNEDSSMNYKDNHYHFRQDSSFLYFFGLDLQNLVAVIDENGQAILFGDDFTIDQIIWTGKQPSMHECGSKVGVQNTKPLRELTHYLSSKKKVHFLPPYRPEQAIKLAEWLSIPLNKVSEHKSVELIRAIVSLREIKTDEEIIEIEKAVNTTVKMHTAAIKYGKPGIKESEVVAKVHAEAIADGGNLSFPIIGTINGNTLHTYYHGNTIQDGDLFLCDSGAETSMRYAGDMTRTFPVGPKYTSRQKEIYDIVLNAHLTAIEALKPGVLFKDIHLLACKTLVDGLKQINLMQGDTEEAVANGAHTMFFQCGLGHMMGLDVHDMENLGEQYVGYTNDLTKSTEFGLKSLRLGKALKKGFVLTVEPGIYIIPDLIDLWSKTKKNEEFINYGNLQKYRDFGGIRIEDDFLITEKGYKLLGKPLARTTEEIEDLKRS
ncbi:aminopeptidase P family protein [Marinigracilibium pacificum]|uniref:Xaa-Pro aminopeptidase n=1 Tax=Marinigracilibium pacificum TaxID=2729599 RepID=A0A848J4F3_9BACT|nr:aminopeptidase P family protein [Marinigracilibium pacificum]NMM50375.1 aminopeptidase P family protein [Marinigracilibium pacificum]